MKNIKLLLGVSAVAALVFIAACSCSNDSDRTLADLSRSQGVYKVGGNVTGLRRSGNFCTGTLSR